MPRTATTHELGAHGNPKTARDSASANVLRNFALEETLSEMRYSAYQAHLKIKDALRAEREACQLAASRATDTKTEAEHLVAADECTKKILAEDKRFASDSSIPHSNETICNDFLNRAGYQKLRDFGIADHVAAGEHELVKLTASRTPVEAVEALFRVAKECDVETKRVENATLPMDDRLAAVMSAYGYGEEEFVESVKNSKRPDIDSRGNFSMPIVEPATIKLVVGDRLQSIDDGFALAAFMLRDKIREKATTILKREDYTGAIALADRKPMMDAIAERRLFAERLAEHYFREGRKTGVAVKRFSRDPLAALDIHPLAKR